MTRVLVTAFEPFDGSRINASWEAVRRLPGSIRTASLHPVLLPCAFGRSIVALHDAYRRVVPDLVICVGEAGGRTQLSIERVAINLDDAPIPDNDAQQPRDEPIDMRGPVAYFTSLPAKAAAAAAKSAGVAASVSFSAGSYVCNHVFYELMRKLDSEPRDVIGGFVHVPPVGVIEPDAAARGLIAVIDTCLQLGSADIRVTGGRED